MFNLAIGCSSKKYVAALASFAVASSIALAPAAQAKKLSFEMPTYNKLTTDAGPQTNDIGTMSGAPSNPNFAPPGKATAAIDLTPLTLGGDAPPTATTGEGVLKGEVDEAAFAAKNNAGSATDPNAVASGQSKSVVRGPGNQLVRDGHKVNAAPLALMESIEEVNQQVDTKVEAEKLQLQDLWQATIMRNPDIQFVINKLQPTSDQSHATSYMMKALGQALFGIMSAAPLMMPSPNPAMFMGTNAGVSMLSNLFSSHDQKQAKKYAISQEQATILYKIVRDVADKLVGSYRDYKKEITAFNSAQRDFEDLKTMVAEQNKTVDPAKAIDMEYTLRKAKRDLEIHGDNIRRERQELVDLGGAEAIAKLDAQFDEERSVLMKLAGDDAGAVIENKPITAPNIKFAGKEQPEQKDTTKNPM